MQSAFWSSYENAKRVIEPSLEALWQALLQLAYTVWQLRTAQVESIDSEFYLTIASIVASILQLYKVYHYLSDLRISYRLSWWRVVSDLLSLGSKSQAPFRFVLRSWQRVDYSQLLDDSLGDDPSDTKQMGQIAQALVDNDVLVSLTFGSHQLSEERLKVLEQGLKGNSHLRELIVVDTGGEGIPGECVNGILEAAPHLVKVFFGGVHRNSSHWKTLAAALAPMRLESFGMSYKLAEKKTEDLGQKQAERAATDTAKVLAEMRTLHEVRLRGLPCHLLGAVLRPAGLPRSRTIRRVDLSFNSVELPTARAMTAWVRKGLVKELVCEGLALVHQDREPLSKHLAPIEGIYPLVRAMGSTSSKVEVFVLTLNHPIQGSGDVASRDAGAQTGVAGAVSLKQLKRLTNTCHTAASDTREGRFFCVGLHNSLKSKENGDDQAEAYQRGALAEIKRRVKRVVLGLMRQLLPCFSFADDSLESVLASLALQDVGKSGGVHSISQCCRELCSTNATRVAYFMLRRVPNDFALDVRVLLKHLLSREQPAQDSSRGRTGGEKEHDDPVVGFDDPVPEPAQDSSDPVAGMIRECQTVRLASCGISGTNLGSWLSLFLISRRLSLVDCNLERAELDKMRRYFKRRGPKGCLPCVGCWEQSRGDLEVRLQVLDFVTMNPVPPDVAMALVHLAHDVDVECTLGARRDFRFPHKRCTEVVTAMVVEDHDRGTSHDDFFRVAMAPVWSRSGPEWDKLRDATDILQNHQVGECITLSRYLCPCRGEPRMNEAHAMLLLFSTFDLSAVERLDLYGNLDVKSLDMRGEMVSLIGRFLLPRLQTLDLRWCSGLRALPVEIGGLTGLQTLDLRSCKGLGALPVEIGALTKLQTL
ncbi:MAG: hypothetical protein ACPIOQ_07680, partial [Promethearchaeia archaeon]